MWNSVLTRKIPRWVGSWFFPLPFPDCARSTRIRDPPNVGKPREEPTPLPPVCQIRQLREGRRRRLLKKKRKREKPQQNFLQIRDYTAVSSTLLSCFFCVSSPPPFVAKKSKNFS